MPNVKQKLLDAHAAKLMAEAKEYLESKGELEPPIIEILISDGTSHRVAMFPPPPKDVAMKVIHDYAQDHKAIAVIMVQDGWYRQPDPGEKPSDYTKVPIKDHPNKREALVCMTVYPDSSATMTFAPYRREGNLIVWEPLPPEMTDSPGTQSQTEQRMIKPWAELPGGQVN